MNDYDALSTVTILGKTLEEIELEIFRKSLIQNSGNVSAAAKALNVSRNKFYRKLRPFWASQMRPFPPEVS